MDKRAFIQTLGTLMVAAPVAALTAQHTAPSGGAENENVFKRVTDSMTIRAGWFEEPPFTFYDPLTKKLSGIAIEIAERLCTSNGFKLEWVSAINFSTFVEDLAIGRFDVIFGSILNLPRGGRVDFTEPYAFVPMYGYVQQGKKPFNSLADLNSSKARIAVLDGEGGTLIARQKFPAAHFVTLPNSATIPELLMQVATGKADIAFVMPTVYEQFNRNNPNQVIPFNNDEPLHIFAVSFGLKPDEYAFQSLLNNNLRRMIVAGETEDIFKKYDEGRSLLRPSISFTREAFK